MRTKNPVALTLDGNADNYTNDHLSMPQKDIEGMISESVEGRFFGAECDLSEGCNHRMAIDTSFENTSEPYMDVVRSDVTRYEDRPAPHDVKRGEYPHRRY